jgi:MFS transporter, CP family, cyanate transporter
MSTVLSPRRRTGLSPALIIAGLLLIGSTTRAPITTVGPVLAEVKQQLALSSATASALISLPLLAFAVVSPFAPGLARRLGLEQALAGALGLLAVGIVLRSLPGAAALWSGTVLIGVAIAVLNVDVTALLKRDFPHRFGGLTGAYSATQSVFAALAAGLAVPLATASAAGWRLSLGVWAGLVLIALGVFFPQLRRRDVVPAAADDLSLDAVVHPDPAGRSPWRTPLGWQVTAYMGLQSLGYYVMVTWLPGIERSAGIAPAAAGVHQLLLNVFAIGGSLAASALLPRFRDQRLLAAIAPGFFLVAVIGLLAHPQLGAVWASLAGIAGGMSIVVALSFFGFRTDHHTQAAALSGMAQSVGYLLAAAGPIAVGALHDASGSWTAPLIVLLVVGALTLGAGQLAGRDRRIG